MTLRTEAESLRLALILGLIDAHAVVGWADSVIMSDRSSEAPVVLDLSLAAQKPVAELVSLLGQVSGDVDKAAVGRELAGQLRECLRSQRLDIVALARAMYRLLHEGYAPDKEFETMAYVIDDGVDLALEGVYGTLEDVRQEMATFLDRYPHPVAKS